MVMYQMYTGQNVEPRPVSNPDHATYHFSTMPVRPVESNNKPNKARPLSIWSGK